MAKRVKAYDLPHKALRTALSQLSLLAGNTSYDDRDDVKRLYSFGQDVFRLLDVHAHDENGMTLAELEVKCPGGSERDMNDHEAVEKVQSTLRDLLAKIDSDSEAGMTNQEDIEEFYLGFSEFHAAYLQHIAREERITQLLLWEHFTDEELVSLRVKIIKGMSPEMLLTWFRFMVPAQSRSERVAFLGGIKKMAPEPFFAQGMQVVRDALPQKEFEYLSIALSD